MDLKSKVHAAGGGRGKGFGSKEFRAGLIGLQFSTTIQESRSRVRGREMFKTRSCDPTRGTKYAV